MGWILKAGGSGGRRPQPQPPEDADWWARYDAYLASPEWQARRRLVLKRANGMCEGCGLRPAAQVHHLTYQHVGAEFLWELRAVCLECHQALHPGGNGR
jgi:5-methylcytosine-specific restriction endonuclease McrA